MRIPMQPEAEPQFQMAPMIDMVFLLVIFFMTASHLNSTKNLDLNIPTAASGTIPKERPDRWTVNVTRDGAIFSGQQPVSLDELRGMVASRIEREPDTKVYLRADQGTPHRDVRLVMNAMAEAGVDDFIFGVFTPVGGD